MNKLFSSQSDTEKVYLVIRQHWIVPAGKLALIACSAIALTVAWLWLPNVMAGIFTEAVSDIFNLLYFAVLLILLLGSLVVFVLYYLSLQVITDLRMVDVDQLSLFHRDVSEIFIENVEEPTSKSYGFLATFLDYGDVTVQTSGASIQFVFEKVPHPESVKKLILDLYERKGTRMNPHHLKPNAATTNVQNTPKEK